VKTTKQLKWKSNTETISVTQGIQTATDLFYIRIL